MHIFISYAKKDTRSLALDLEKKLKLLPGISAWVDRSLKAGRSWEIQIQSEIDRCDYVVVLYSPDINRHKQGKEESYVLTEITYAKRFAHKSIIPVMVEKTDPPLSLVNEHYLDFTVPGLSLDDLVVAICDEIGYSLSQDRLVPVSIASVSNEVPAMPTEMFVNETEAVALDRLTDQHSEHLASDGLTSEIVLPLDVHTNRAIYRRPAVLISIISVALVIFTVILLSVISLPITVTPTKVGIDPTDTSSVVILPISVATQAMNETPISTITALLADRLFPTPSFTNTPRLTNILTPTFPPSPTRTPAITLTVSATITLNVTNTFAFSPTPSGTPSFTTQISATTFTPSQTNSPTAFPLTLAKLDIPVTHNSDWRPQYQTFNGFEMVLVPVGCFMMGSDDGELNEKPVVRQCIDQPFWLNRTEVTNAQYGSSGMFDGNNQPRERVGWFESRDFCVSRGARLPTELEWEFAARGPDNLVYPWGNNFVGEYVIYSVTKTVDVATKPNGKSWVGAFDLSGNVWEWVSTIYDQKRFPYPYQEHDGREYDSDIISNRGLRGGSMYDTYFNFRTSYRRNYNPNGKDANIGFRCARNFNPADLSG